MGLVGQNGAGKSTLHQGSDRRSPKGQREIVFAGETVEFASPLAAQHGGISTIYQEINLIPFRSVAEKHFPRPRISPLRLARLAPHERERGRIAGGRFAVEIDVRRPLMDSAPRSTDGRHRARRVVQGAPGDHGRGRVVARRARSRGSLRRQSGQLRAEGVSVIFITHRLDELYQICDRVTVMRDGRTVNDAAGWPTSTSCISSRRCSGAISKRCATRDRIPGRFGGGGRRGARREGLAVGRRSETRARGRAGQIVGLAAWLDRADGSGARDFRRRSARRRAIRLMGRDAAPREPVEAIALGVDSARGFASGGIVPDMSVRENITLALLPRLTRFGVVDEARQRAIVDRFIVRLAIKTADIEQKVRELSGGNQRRFCWRGGFARTQAAHPRRAHRGIDVGAKVEIQSLIKSSPIRVSAF